VNGDFGSARPELYPESPGPAPDALVGWPHHFEQAPQSRTGGAGADAGVHPTMQQSAGDKITSGTFAQRPVYLFPRRFAKRAKVAN
jgi:hypothetical protein